MVHIEDKHLIYVCCSYNSDTIIKHSNHMTKMKQFIQSNNNHIASKYILHVKNACSIN